MPDEAPEIRRALKKDLPEIYELINAFSPEDAAAFTETKGREVFILERDGRIIGVTGLIGDELSDRACWLGWTYVRTDVQRQGVGAELLAFVRSRLRGRRLFVTTSSEPKYSGALAFYAKHGFAEAGRLHGFYPAGDLIILESAWPEKGRGGKHES